MEYTDDERYQYGTIPQIIDGLKSRFSAKITTRSERNIISKKCKFVRDDSTKLDGCISFKWETIEEKNIVITIRYDGWDRIFCADCTAIEELKVCDDLTDFGIFH